MKSPVQFIYCDLGGVLFHFSDALKQVAEKHGKTYDDCKRVFWEHSEKVLRGQMHPQELWEKYKLELGFEDPEGYEGEVLGKPVHFDYLKYWTSHLTPIKSMHDFLRKMNEKGVGLGLLTNMYRGVVERAMENGCIPDLPYSVILQSCETGLMKPENALYELAEKEAERIAGITSPESILLIDDKPEFLVPAEKRGWQTFLFEGEEKNIDGKEMN